jgi:hypothetical protein
MTGISIISKVVSKVSSESLRKGDILQIWMKKGDWWTEIRRGVKLEVRDVQEDTIRVHFPGWSEGPGWEMSLPPRQDLSKKFNLIGDPKFRRSLVVQKV